MRICAFLFSCFFLVYAQTQINWDSIVKKSEEVVEMMPDGFYISIGLVKNGQVHFLGWTTANGNIQKSDLKDSLFEIGSITKVFTSTLLAQAVNRKEIKSNAAVNKIFPYQFNENIKLTFQELSNHTSGLYRLPTNIFPLLMSTPENPYRMYSSEMLDNYLKNELILEFPAKKTFSYSNLGAGILAYALSLKKQKPFEEMLAVDVFQKYGLLHTNFGKETSIAGINELNEPATNWDFNALKGAGGLVSNTADMTRLIIAELNADEDLALTQKETFVVSDNMSIGMGWFIIGSQDVNKKYFHNGGTGGFCSSMVFCPTTQSGVVILTNISAMHPSAQAFDPLCFELLDLLK